MRLSHVRHVHIVQLVWLSVSVRPMTMSAERLVLVGKDAERWTV